MGTKATSFDAECYAAFRGLQKAEEVLRETDHTIVFASDNIVNLRHILKPSKIGPCQLVGVWTNDILKRLGCKVVFLWLPSHVGIKRNEEADRLAGDMAKWPWTREEDRPDWRGTYEPLYGDIERYNTVWLKTGERDCYATTRANTPTCTKHVLLTQSVSPKPNESKTYSLPVVPQRNQVLR